MSDEVKLGAVDMGFDATWIADVLTNYGADVLTLAIEAARQGLSVGLVVEVLQKFGPSILDLVVSLLTKKNAMALSVVVDPFVPGPVAGDAATDAFLQLIVEKYIPMIVEKYGPQLLQALLDFILSAVQKK